jgi:catechol 2,3-dioxygenase-like lactoylglutathione lyase family enzyme
VLVPLPRLRQVVLAARDLDAVTARLEATLGVREPFRDPGVSHFGLVNAVYAVGDTFVEVVAPMQEGTAAGRHLDRRGGDAGYMVMFEVDDAPAARERLHELGVRVVWETTHDDIVDLHLHPRDVPGAIVALDATKPVGSWRWGGPDWAGRVPTDVPAGSGVRGVTVAVPEPAAVARRWCAVLGVPGTGEVIRLGDGSSVRFVSDANGDGLIGVQIAGLGETAEIAGVRFEPSTEEVAP